MTSRTDVYKAIDSERDYQDLRWNPSTTESGGNHSITEWIAYMENYQAEAKQILARTARQDAYPVVIEIMRKIVALGVKCMEEHGAPRRPGMSKTLGQVIRLEDARQKRQAASSAVVDAPSAV